MSDHAVLKILADLWVNKKPELLENTKSLIVEVNWRWPILVSSLYHTSVVHPRP